MVEACDKIDGFITYHSLCGGTGSYLGPQILQKL